MKILPTCGNLSLGDLKSTPHPLLTLSEALPVCRLIPWPIGSPLCLGLDPGMQLFVLAIRIDSRVDSI